MLARKQTRMHILPIDRTQSIHGTARTCPCFPSSPGWGVVAAVAPAAGWIGIGGVGPRWGVGGGTGKGWVGSAVTMGGTMGSRVLLRARAARMGWVWTRLCFVYVQVGRTVLDQRAARKVDRRSLTIDLT